MGASLNTTPTVWLNVAEASRLLGVNPTTLRHWTDAGQIPAIRTPGGHRRYDAEALRKLLRSQQARSPLRELLVQLRQGMEEARPQHAEYFRAQEWYGGCAEEARRRLGEWGRALFETMVRYATERNKARAHLTEGQRLAREAGLEAATLGLSAPQTVEAFLSCRRPVQELLGRLGRKELALDARAIRALMQMGGFLDEVLVATLKGHEEAALLGVAVSAP